MILVIKHEPTVGLTTYILLSLMIDVITQYLENINNFVILDST